MNHYGRAAALAPVRDAVDRSGRALSASLGALRNADAAAAKARDATRRDRSSPRWPGVNADRGSARLHPDRLLAAPLGERLQRLLHPAEARLPPSAERHRHVALAVGADRDETGTDTASECERVVQAPIVPPRVTLVKESNLRRRWA